MSDEYLTHYGVLGMKWGVYKSGKDYRYTSKATKNFNKKADKLATKIDKTTDRDKKRELRSNLRVTKQKAKISQKMDDEILKNVKKTGMATTALSVVQPGAVMTYEMQKVANHSSDKTNAAVTTAMKVGTSQVSKQIAKRGAVPVTMAVASQSAIIGANAVSAVGMAAPTLLAMPINSVVTNAVQTSVRNKYINDNLKDKS